MSLVQSSYFLKQLEDSPVTASAVETAINAFFKKIFVNKNQEWIHTCTKLSAFVMLHEPATRATAASSTFDPVAHQKALDKLRESEAAIGARPAMPVYYNDEEDDEDVNDKDNVPPTPAGSALSYDVFAPPGALGIVVDTTEKGCIVYSLKKSSPMQGLMNKGDLIIGLDNFDVRNMDAASLTKLMAKKAQQAERKFTLMPTSS